MNFEQLSDLYDNKSTSLSDLIENLKNETVRGDLEKLFHQHDLLKKKIDYLSKLKLDPDPKKILPVECDIKELSLIIIQESMKSGHFIGLGWSKEHKLELIPIYKGVTQVPFNIDFKESQTTEPKTPVLFFGTRIGYTGVKFLIASKLKETEREEIEKYFTELTTPDYKDWLSKTVWPLDNAIPLAYGVEPHSTLGSSMKNQFEMSYPYSRPPAYVSDYHKAAEPDNKHFYKPQGVDPKLFCIWAQKNLNVELPEEIKNWIKTSTSTKKDEDSINQRKRNNMLKMILGMAIGGYNYDPNSNRNPATGDIQKSLETQGLNLSQDTIRNYLNEAKELH